MQPSTGSCSGSRPPPLRYPLGPASPSPLRPGLLLPSPTSTCHRLSAAAAPWSSQITFAGASVAHHTAPRAPLVVGSAVRSGADPGPPSGPSHGGGRGRGRLGGNGHQGPRGVGGGRGRHEGRAYEGREREGRQGRGRSSARGFDLSTVEDLGQLQEVVEQHAKQWADEGEVGTLVAAFGLACKLPHTTAGGPPEATARRALLHTLAGVYLRLLPSVTRPDYCTRPLWACAKTGYGWAGGAAELPLAEALLGRLGEDGCALLQRAKPKEHANLWWSLSEAPNTSRLVAAQGQLLAASAECLVGMRARDMDPQACANVLLACARLQHSPTHVPLVHHLTRCLAELSDAKPQELSNALYALGELREDCGHVPHQEDLGQLMSVVRQRLRGGRAGEEVAGAFKPQEVSNMLLGCSKLGAEDGEAVQLLAAAAGAAAGRMTGQSLANSVWALGKLLGGGDDSLAPTFIAAGDDGEEVEANRTTRSTPAPGDAAAAAANYTTPALAASKLFREVQRRLNPTSPASPGRVSHTGRTSRQDGAAGAPADFKPQELSNLLYGMALLLPYIASLQSAYSGAQGTYVGPALTALAAARKALAEECHRRLLGGFCSQGLSNAAWALAKMGHADQGWFADAVAAAQRPAFTSGALPIAWAQLWYALALVRHRPPPELLRCTAEALEGQVWRAKPHDCASLLWSFVVLGVWEERLAGLLLGRLAELVERQQQGQQQQPARSTRTGGDAAGQAPLVTTQALSNALWAVAVVGPWALAAHAREVGVLLREAARRWEQGGGGGPAAPFSTEHLVQLWQVQLELEAMEGGEGGEAADLSLILPGARCGVGGGATSAPGEGSMRAAMGHAAREQWEVLGDASASQLQRDVVAALRRLQRRQQHLRTSQVPGSERQCPAEGVTAPGGTRRTSRGYSGAAASLVIIDVQHEAPVPALGSRVDVLVPLSDGRDVAVEVDGPTHFLCNDPYMHTKDGPTRLRDRQLARVFGQDNAVSVRHWAWRAVRGDEAAEEQYVWGLIVGVEGGTGAEARAGHEEAAVACSAGHGSRPLVQHGEGVGQMASEAAATGAAAAAEGKTRKPRQRRQQQEGQQGQSTAAAYAPGGGAAGQAAAGDGVDAAVGPAGARRERPRAGSQGLAERELGPGSTVTGGAAAAPGRTGGWWRWRWTDPRTSCAIAHTRAQRAGQPRCVTGSWHVCSGRWCACRTGGGGL